MSHDETEPQTNADKGDQVLEHNLDLLLEKANQPPVMQPEARARVLAALKAKARERAEAAGTSPAARPFASRQRRRVALAAGGAAVAAAAVLAWQLVGGGGIGGGNEQPNHFANPGPAASVETLSDGSQLILRAGAEIERIGDREFELIRGEVLFDVARGGGTFVVATRHGKVTVLGTRFALSAGDDQTLAAVIRGRVAVENDHGKEELGAGEEAVFSAQRAPERRPAPRLSHLTSWAREARVRQEKPEPGAARRGNLLARNPNWQESQFPLPMRALTVDVQVENQVARVAVDQTFFNHRSWDLEGVYSFPLPPSAAISRLAMYVNGELMEAGIVERERGRRIYESIVYRRRDPALLEWMAGNNFQVRIFPLLGRREKRILLSYTQPLPRLYDDMRLEVPIPELDLPVDKVNYRVRLAKCGGCDVRSSSHEIAVARDGDDTVVTFEAKNYRIGDDLVLNVREAAEAPRVVVHEHDGALYWMARVAPRIDKRAPTTAARPRRWVILHDTSASRGPLERQAQVHLIDRFLREMDEQDHVALIAFDATVRPMSERFATVGEADQPAFHRFAEEQAAEAVGETDLAGALDAAVAMLATPGGDGYDPHILYLGDGLVTASERQVNKLVERVVGRATVVTVAVGESQDARVLAALADATGGASVSMNLGEDLDWRAFDLIAALNTPRVLGVSAALAGAIPGQGGEGNEFYASRRQIADGEELTVIGRVRGGALPAGLVLSGTVAGQPWRQEVTLAAAVDRHAGRNQAGYLPRLWAQRHIDALIGKNAEESKADITRLGLEHWLITPHTSLLVLENEEMYKDFKVARSSDKGWAPYRVPRKIPDRYEPLKDVVDLSGLAPDGAIARTPADMFGYRPEWHGYASDKSGFIGGWNESLSNRRFGLIGRGSIGVGNGVGSGGGGLATRSTESGIFDEAAEERSKAPAAVAAVGKNQPEAEKAMTTGDLVSNAQQADWVSADWKVPSQSWNGARADRDSDRARSVGRRGPAWYGSNVYPQAFHLGDARLWDLTEFVPGLNSDELDARRELLVRDSTGTRGTISDPARRLVEGARNHLAGQGFIDASGQKFWIAKDGGWRAHGVTADGLVEEIAYDGDSLYHIYPELELAVRRPVGATEMALLGRYLPFFIARPERIAAFYDAELKGNATVVLSRAGKGDALFEIDFDVQGRVIAIRRHQAGAGSATRTLAFEYLADRIVIDDGGGKFEFTRLSASEQAPPVTIPDAQRGTVVDMPLRNPEHWRKVAAGTPQWRHTQRQLLASYAALGQSKGLYDTALAMAKEAPLSPGEMALASRGVLGLTPAQLSALLGAGAGTGSHVVAAFLRASRENRAAAFEQLAVDRPGTLIGKLSRYRAALLRVSTDGDARALANVVRAAYKEIDVRLAYVLAWQFQQRFAWQHSELTAALWSELPGEGTWRILAENGAGQILYGAGRYEAAAEHYERAFVAAEKLGVAPAFDYTAIASFQQFGNRSRWVRLWKRWSARALASDRPELLLGLISTALISGEQREFDRAVARAIELDIRDPNLITAMVGYLLGANRPELARALLTPALTRIAEPPAELQFLAAQVAERQGDLPAAARALELGLDAGDQTAIELGVLRARLAHLIELRGRIALMSSGEAREHAVAAALRTIANWRRVDPDNAQIDRMAAELLFDLGRRGEAWRQLSSVIERHPAEGTAYQVAAEVLEAEGELERADALWGRAMVAEPTDPTWILRRAQAQLALGHDSDARHLLDNILGRKWHERFANVRAEAERLRRERFR